MISDLDVRVFRPKDGWHGVYETLKFWVRHWLCGVRHEMREPDGDCSVVRVSCLRHLVSVELH